MERLPVDLSLKIFCLLDFQNLASAQQGMTNKRSRTKQVSVYASTREAFMPKVCSNWRVLASNNILWANLFKERWGGDHAAFYCPVDSKPWKDVYEVQDRCDRVGLGLKIIREGEDYYLVHQGEIQRHLGSKRQKKETHPLSSQRENIGFGAVEREEPCLGILDKILFFLGDLEAASSDAKRSRVA